MDKTAVSTYLQSDTLLNSRFLIHKRIASGSFGSVFLVTNKDTQIQMALKLELLKESNVPYLKKEQIILKKLQGIQGITKIHSSGKTKKLAFLEIDLLNRDFSQIIKKQPNIGTPFLSEIASKLFKILQQIHSKGVLHRDLKPHNIMLDQNNNVYLVDFGISQYSSPEKKQVSTKRNRFVGTPRYASVAAHQNKNQTPRDEIESLLYVLIFLVKRQLPWMNTPTNLGHKTDDILKIKLKTSRKTLCAGLPPCFLEAFKHIDRTNNPIQIDYEYLSLIFMEQNRLFPKIRVQFEDQTPQTPKHFQFRRANSQKCELKQSKQYLMLPQQTQRRISLQQPNLLTVPSSTNFQNSYSSNYDSEMNYTQLVVYECSINNGSERSQRIQQSQTLKDIIKNIDEHSTSQQSVGKKLRPYSTLYPNRKICNKRK